MRINFQKNIVQTDSRNYTYDDLEDIFTDMETEEYVNVSSRFVKWQKERLVSGSSISIFFLKLFFCIFKGTPDQAILFLKSMAERGGSDIGRL